MFFSFLCWNLCNYVLLEINVSNYKVYSTIPSIFCLSFYSTKKNVKMKMKIPTCRLIDYTTFSLIPFRCYCSVQFNNEKASFFSGYTHILHCIFAKRINLNRDFVCSVRRDGGGGKCGFILLWKVKEEGGRRWSRNNKGRVKYVNFTCTQWYRQKQRINIKYIVLLYSIHIVILSVIN